jgi:flagellar biosynthesis/type III secretory pathway protein FliH
MGVLDVRTQHRYQTCRDEDCQRYACRVYREGYANGKEAGKAEGRAAGLAEGYSKGHTAGYSEGYTAGAASAKD